MRAIVTLKEGKTYRYGAYTFTASPSYITNPTEIAYLQTVGCLNVKVEDAPAAKPIAKPAAKAVPAAVEEAPGTEPEPEPEHEKSKKPGPPKSKKD